MLECYGFNADTQVYRHLYFFGQKNLMTQLSYAAAGVDIDAGDELVERIKPLAKRTMIPGVLASVGLSLIHI